MHIIDDRRESSEALDFPLCETAWCVPIFEFFYYLNEATRIYLSHCN